MIAKRKSKKNFSLKKLNAVKPEELLPKELSTFGVWTPRELLLLFSALLSNDVASCLMPIRCFFMPKKLFWKVF